MVGPDGVQSVKVPVELHEAPHRVLEDYVRARLMQFCPGFAARIAPGAPPNTIQVAAAETIAALPPPDYSDASLESRDLQLVFRHDCQSLGCLDPQCVLCEHNPHRRCSLNFSAKYLVNDVLRAKCEAPIRVEIIDRGTGQPVAEDIPGIVLELCVLDGNQYDARCSERSGEERIEDLEACALLLNNKATALLVPGSGGSHSPDSRVIVPLVKGVAVLPDLHISDSSEALLSGRKPPFRLLARAVAVPGTPVGQSQPTIASRIRCAVSEGFVVATRRTRTAGKVDIPNVDDHVGKLEHMGRETVKKLQDIRGSALAAGIDIQVPDNCINKVGEFRKLALLAEADGHLRQKLQQVLKLSKEKWDEARDHAMRAVVADNRMRIWYADKGSMEVGLLFTCRLGSVELDRPVGLLTKKASDGAQTTMEATLMAQQTPSQRDQVRALQPQAATSWWQPGHPGWAIYPVDSDQFLATGALDQASLPLHGGDQVMAPLPSPQAAAAQFPFAPTMSPFMPNDALLRAIGAGTYLGPPGGPPLGSVFAMPGMLPGALGLGALQGSSPTTGTGTTSPFATIQQQQQQQQSAQQQLSDRDAAAQAAMPPPPPHTAGQPACQSIGGQQNGGPAGTAFAIAGVRPTSIDGSTAPMAHIGNFQSILGGDLHTKLPFSIQNFPSLPGAGNLPGSGDLESLLAGHGGGDPVITGGRFPSLAFGKSLELMDGPVTAVAAGGNAPKENGSGAGITRKQSGLESMQSIENALTDSQRAQSVHDAIDAAVAAVNRTQGPRQSLSGTKRK